MQAYLLMYTGNKMHGKLNSVCPLKKSEIGSGKIGNRPIIKIKDRKSDRDPKNVIGTSLPVIFKNSCSTTYWQQEMSCIVLGIPAPTEVS